MHLQPTTPPGILRGGGRSRMTARHVFRLLLVGLTCSLAVPAAVATAQQRPVPAAPQRTTSPDALERMNDSVDALTRKVWPSVVQIIVTSYGPREPATNGEM